MNTPFTYDFGYPWSITWAAAIPFGIFAALTGLALWLGWRRWIAGVSAVLAVWALGSLIVVHAVFRINLPIAPAAERFLASGGGEVVDVGAGSGRAGIGLLLARPGARLTAIDIYDGFWGISDNTPERFMTNARIAGVADRARAQVGDARAIPLADAAYDGVISNYAIDHLRRDEIPTALSEVSRILKPGGEFLLAVVNVDWWVLLASPPIAHHPRADPGRWRQMLAGAGFELLEEGTTPGSLHFLVRKPSATSWSGSPAAVSR
jgi:SAM-dependent methyltransferase